MRLVIMKLINVFFVLFSISAVLASSDFEQEVFTKTSQYLREFRTSRSVPDVKKFIPDKAWPLIEYAKKYFNEKTIQTDRAPKVRNNEIVIFFFIT